MLDIINNKLNNKYKKQIYYVQGFMRLVSVTMQSDSNYRRSLLLHAKRITHLITPIVISKHLASITFYIIGKLY